MSLYRELILQAFIHPSPMCGVIFIFRSTDETAPPHTSPRLPGSLVMTAYMNGCVFYMLGSVSFVIGTAFFLADAARVAKVY